MVLHRRELDVERASRSPCSTGRRRSGRTISRSRRVSARLRRTRASADIDATRRSSAPATAGEQSTSSSTAAAIASSSSRQRSVARDEAGDAGLGPGDDVVVGLADGERDDGERRPRLAQRARRAEALGQVEVERARRAAPAASALELLARGAERGGAADDVEARVAAQRVDDPVAVEPNSHEDEDLDISAAATLSGDPR